jgi:hypothetical protein
VCVCVYVMVSQCCLLFYDLIGGYIADAGWLGLGCPLDG